MQRTFTADELLLDDSFINYCNKANAKDALLWENYLLQHPGEKATIEEAKAFVCGLKAMLREEEKQQSIQNLLGLMQAQQTTHDRLSEMEPPSRKISRIHWWLAAASLAFIVILGTWILKGGSTASTVATTSNNTSGDRVVSVLYHDQVAKTGAAQKKIFFLTDGTKVTMNANSIVSISSTFGRTERLVSLEGEAFFEVKHNAGLPFIVRLEDFDVKVLGTMFNVKSYSGEKTSEATLVKGKVEIVLKNDPGKKLFLNPNQKVVVNNTQPGELSTAENTSIDGKERIATVDVQSSSLSSDGVSIIETDWMQNRLEINDETFIDLKSKLERKYDVRINFSDEYVKMYKFTALFENESIDQVLKAMQLSYSFKYTIQNNEITISK